MPDDFDGLYKWAFGVTALALFLLEQIPSLNRRSVTFKDRWFSNAGLFLVGSAVIGFVLPVGLVAFAADQPPGMLAQLGFPWVAQVLVAFLLLDLWHYLEHRAFHVSPLLWRSHLVHHSDVEVDVTTSERHHPFEILLSAALTVGLIAAFGLPAEAVGLYMLAAMLVAFLSHANLRLPVRVERCLSLIVVTPGVHAVHHSSLQSQTDSNYGIVLTLWDRLLGTYSDAFAVSGRGWKVDHFGLEYFRRPQDMGLTQALIQPFLFRYGMKDSAVSGFDIEAIALPGASCRIDLSPDWRRALRGLALGCTLACLVLWPTVLDLTLAWSAEEAYRYAWLVMPMIIYLLGWHFRDELLRATPKPALTGLFVVAMAVVCWSSGALMNVDIARRFGFVLVLQGILISTMGWRLFGRLLPVLGLMFLMIPSGDFLEPPLRRLTMLGLDLFTTAVGLPHRIEGFSIVIGNQLYFVIDACSGLSYVLLTFFLGYCFGLLMFRSWIKIAGLAFLGALLGVGSNLVRVFTIVMMDWARGSQMDLAAHGKIQWIALFIALGLLFYALIRLEPEMGADTTTLPDGQSAVASSPLMGFTRLQKNAPVLAGLIVLVIVGAVTWLTSPSPRAPHGILTTVVPRHILGWELAVPATSWVVDKSSQFESLTLIYRLRGQDMRVDVIDTLLPTAKLPDSRLIPGDREVWRDVQSQKRQSCADSVCMTLFETTWQRGRAYALRHVYHSYNINGSNLKSKVALRAVHGWHRLTRTGASPRLIVITVEGEEPSLGDVAVVQRTLDSALSFTGN